MSDTLNQAIKSLIVYGSKLITIRINEDRTGISHASESDFNTGRQPTPELIADLSAGLFQNDVFLQIISSPGVTWVILDVMRAQFIYQLGDHRVSIHIKPVMHLTPVELYFLLFGRYPQLVEVMSGENKTMVALVDIISGHVCTYSKDGFRKYYQWSLNHMFDMSDRCNVEPVTNPMAGALFSRAAPKLTLHRMQAIASHDISVITIARGNIGFIHTGLAMHPRRDVIDWISSLNKTNVEFLIRAIYDRPFTSGVIDQSAPRPDGAVDKKHPLHARGERRVLMNGDHAPIAVTIDRTYM